MKGKKVGMAQDAGMTDAEFFEAEFFVMSEAAIQIEQGPRHNKTCITRCYRCEEPFCLIVSPEQLSNRAILDLYAKSRCSSTQISTITGRSSCHWFVDRPVTVSHFILAADGWIESKMRQFGWRENQRSSVRSATK